MLVKLRIFKEEGIRHEVPIGEQPELDSTLQSSS